MKPFNSNISSLSHDLIEELQDIDIQDKNVSVFIKEKDKIKVNQQFSLCFLENFQSLTKDLTRRELIVFMSLVKFSKFKNVYKITQKTIEKDTGIKQTNISVVLKKLKEKNYILHDEENEVDYINPYIFLKGSIKEFKTSNLYYELKKNSFENIKDPFM